MLTLAIQAGGESRRFGQNKALFPFLGQPLISRVLARLAPLADEILVTTNQPDDLRFLNVRLVADLQPGRGALGGLYTALNAATQPLVAVVACDMPFVNANLLAAERDLLLETGMDAVVPVTELGMEPLHAIYNRAACLPVVEAAVRAGEWKLTAWLPRIRWQPFPASETVRYDPQGLAFRNLNTLDELRQAEQLAQTKIDL